MSLPPKYPHRFTCTQCKWKGPVQKADVLCGPLECPKCGIRLLLKSVSTSEHLDILGSVEYSY